MVQVVVVVVDGVVKLSKVQVVVVKGVVKLSIV